MQNRPRLRPPFPRKRVEGKPLEKLAPPLEHRLQGGEHERLAEAPRTGDEELLVGVAAHFVEKRRLVYVHSLPALDQRWEIEHARSRNLNSSFSRFHVAYSIKITDVLQWRLRAVCPVAMWFAQAIVLTRSSPAGDYCFPVMKYASMTRPMICLPSSPEWTKSRL